jgi:phosphatidate phosphatase APP1
MTTTEWKARLRGLISNIDTLSDEARIRVRRLCGMADPLRILSYLGYGTRKTLFLSGRVLEDEGCPPVQDSDTAWDNAVNFYKRLASDEVPGARLCARFRGQEQHTTADAEGYFRVAFHPAVSLPDRLWHDVELELLHPPSRTGQRVQTFGQVLVPPPSAEFGVISDIDDTVLWTKRRLTA